MTELIAGVCPSVIKNLCNRISNEVNKRKGNFTKGHEVLVLQALLYALEELGTPVMWEDIVKIHDIIRGSKDKRICINQKVDRSGLRQAVMLIEAYTDEQWKIENPHYQPMQVRNAPDDDIPF